MQKNTSDIYRKNFYLPSNAFINIKIGFLYKTMHHHTVRTSYKVFYKKHSIHVLSKHMNGPRRYLIAIPSITIFGIKWKKKYMKIDVISHLKTRENWRSGSKVYGKILPSVYQRLKEQSVCWKIKSGQRKRRSLYQNDLWLRFIRTLILFLYNFKFLILTVLVFNTKTFCVQRLIKKDKKSQNNHWRQHLNKWKLSLFLYFL